MHAAFTETQEMFRRTVRDLLADRCGPGAVRGAAEHPPHRVAGLWRDLADMGVLGALVPESLGGLGMDETDLVGVLEEVGYAACPEPVAEHAAVALPALAEALGGDPAADPGGLLAAGIEGTVTVVVRMAPAGRYVPHLATADAVVVERDGALVVFDAGDLDRVEQPALDATRRPGTFEVPPDGGTVLVGADPARAADRGTLAVAAQCIGVARRLLDDTVAYVGDRYQFGKPVGSYQAVKHRLADVRLAVEFAAPLVYRAAWTVANDGPDRAREVSAAKAAASDAVDRACRGALQCHGAIGYTAEYDLHLWLERGWSLAAAWGDARWHRARVAGTLGLGPRRPGDGGGS